MSRTEFEEIFLAFQAKFTPAASLDESNLRLTTADISRMIQDFHPELELPRQGITRFLIEQGYHYEPVEYNGEVKYYWLVLQA